MVRFAIMVMLFRTFVMMVVFTALSAAVGMATAARDQRLASLGIELRQLPQERHAHCTIAVDAGDPRRVSPAAPPRTRPKPIRRHKENDMKTLFTASPLLLALTLLAGCSAPSESSVTADISPGATTAAASGVVEAVDVAGRAITIAHGPVDALKWPAMTMTFQALDADLGSIKPGDHVAFEFRSTGMNGTITTITRQ
jgi:Cu(I)/Ag(I) efflux system protein CusF